VFKVQAKVKAVNSSKIVYSSTKLQCHYLENRYLNFNLRENLKYIPALKSFNTSPEGL
jgi:hypothetical protein